MNLVKLLPLILVAGLMAGCVGQGQTTTTQATLTQATTQPTQTTIPSGSAKVFTITASQFKFDPDTITVNKGDVVTLKMTSIDVAHGIGILDYGINVDLPPGQEKDVTFTADKAGTFNFFCNVPCGPGHRDMKGKLVVT